MQPAAPAKDGATGFRERLREKPLIADVIGAAMLLIAGVLLARSYWPQRQADLSKAFYTVDDGKTWFASSAFLVPPFEHEGKTAFVAQVYSYGGGGKQFCAYMAEFTPEAKTQLEAALAAAQSKGQPPGTVALYSDPQFMRRAMQVKKPGSGNAWINQDDPKAVEVMAVRSPDGSEVDQVFVR